MIVIKLRNNFLSYKLFPPKITLKILMNQEWRWCSNFQKENSPRKTWRVLFFGTDEFGLVSLKKLHREYRLQRLVSRLEVVTAYQGLENCVIKYAQDHGIELHNWPLRMPILGFDIGLVVSFGHLIPTDVIESFPLGMINVHGSLLPRWRGAAPIIHALMHGDKKTGITIMKVAPKKFDIGQILAQREMDIDPHEVQTELYKRLADAGGDLLLETIGKLPDAIHSAVPQSNDNVTYAPKIKKDISIVKWDEMTAEQVYNLQRALTGIFPLKTTFQEKPIKIFGVKLSVKPPNNVIAMERKPGIVFYNKEERLLMVQCKRGDWVTVDEVVLPGKKKVSAKAFNNGYIQNQYERVIIFGNKIEQKGEKAVL